MRIGLAVPAMLDGVDRKLLLSWARRIEADGYSTIGFGERISYRNLEAFTVLSAAAAVTERVDIAASVVVLPMHSEVWVAEQITTLDVGLRRAGRARRRRRRARSRTTPRSAGRSTITGTGSTPRSPASASSGTAPRRRPASTRWGHRPSTASRSCPPAPAPGRSPATRCGPTASTPSSSTPPQQALATDASTHPRGVDGRRPDRAARGRNVVVVRARRRPGAPAARLRPPLPRRLRHRVAALAKSCTTAGPEAVRAAVDAAADGATTRSSSSPPSPTSPSSTP